MITTDDPALARRMRTFRNHGITSDHRQREQQGSWVYEMVDLGYNYRLTDFQCALGLSQLRKLPDASALLADLDAPGLLSGAASTSANVDEMDEDTLLAELVTSRPIQGPSRTDSRR